jgi:hypothetical protein
MIAPQATAPLVTPEDIAALKAEIARLHADRRQAEAAAVEMHRALTALSTQHAQVQQVQKVPAPDQTPVPRTVAREHRAQRADPAADESATAPERTPEEEVAQVEAQTQAQVELLAGAVLAEPSDPEWAQTVQQALEQALQREDMRDLYLVSADCRTTLCRLELSLHGTTAPEEGFRRLTHFAPWPGQGFFRFDPESGEAVVYLAREGHALPQQPQ